MVGASRDTPADLKKFQEKYDLGFTFLSDPKGTVAGTFGIRPGVRQSVLIDKDGNFKKIYTKVSVKTHAEDVLNDVGK